MHDSDCGAVMYDDEDRILASEMHDEPVVQKEMKMHVSDCDDVVVGYEECVGAEQVPSKEMHDDVYEDEAVPDEEYDDEDSSAVCRMPGEVVGGGDEVDGGARELDSGKQAGMVKGCPVQWQPC